MFEWQVSVTSSHLDIGSVEEKRPRPVEVQQQQCRSFLLDLNKKSVFKIGNSYSSCIHAIIVRICVIVKHELGLVLEVCLLWRLLRSRGRRRQVMGIICAIVFILVLVNVVVVVVVVDDK